MGLFGGRRPRPRWPCWRRWGWFGLEQEEPSPPPETRPRQVAPPLSACTGLHYSANIKLALDWAINAFLILADASACLDVLPFPALQFGSFNFFLFVRSDRCSCSISVAPGKKKAGFYDSLFLKNNSATLPFLVIELSVHACMFSMVPPLLFSNLESKDRTALGI